MNSSVLQPYTPGRISRSGGKPHVRHVWGSCGHCGLVKWVRSLTVPAESGAVVGGSWVRSALTNQLSQGIG